jgi:sterol desaturase/sphingolipid hydroxylase (fatty acid hydroxylase superfamily)
MRDLTVVAIPFYFGSMGAEYLWLREKDAAADAAGITATRDGRDISAGVYEQADTIASLTMGVGSLVLPFVVPKLLRPVTPGRGKYAMALVLTGAGAAVLTTIADQLVRRAAGTDTADRATDLARRVAGAGGVTAIVAGGIAFTTAWADRTTIKRMWKRKVVPDLGTGALATAAAIAGWDFIYYWNHRLMHECRALWAIHVVHHSSQRYNLSTALRQPVADAFGAFIPYSLLALVGIRPELINTARGVNLLYQYWIHTETVDSLGPAENAFNTPSHHRVHHGSNGPYLDRNHGSILIIWDRLFGTFERERQRVRYGLTKNIETFNPVRIASHEHVEMLKDVYHSTNWRDRLSFVLRGPGWAGQRKAGLTQVPGIVEPMA